MPSTTIMIGHRAITLSDLAALLGTRSQQLVADAVRICCPARPGEPGVNRIGEHDVDSLRNYVAKRHSEGRQQLATAVAQGARFIR